MEEAGWRGAPQIQQPSKEIDQMRNAIDTLDQTIATLLQQRLVLTCQIGAVKAESGIAVKDNGREQKVLENVQSVTNNPEIAQALASIYQTVMRESCTLQHAITNGAAAPAPSDRPNNSTVYFPRVLIIGVGLIGGAIGRQIKRRLPNTTVAAIDRADALEAALERKLIDQAETDLSKAVAKAGLILLCASPSENMRLLAEIAPLTKPRQVVIDVTSTKQQICSLAEQTSMKADFVGGHPLFGSHKSGNAAAAEVIVDGKRFCIVPTKRSSELTLRRVARWLSELGLTVIQTDSSEHDEALAATSHAVQMLAVALGESLAEGRSDETLQSMLALSGPSLQGIARLMASPSDLWLDIVGQNIGPVNDALSRLIEKLEQTKVDIKAKDKTALRKRFKQAARVQTALQKLT